MTAQNPRKRPKDPVAIYSTTFIRVYGEIEFIFAILKILLVIFVVILGLVIDLGSRLRWS
jgi:amino acid permease